MPGTTGTDADPREAFSALLLDHIDAPVIAVDEQGLLVAANQSARRLLRFGEDELPQQPVWKVLASPSSEIAARATVESVLHRQRPESAQVVLTTDNGTPHSLLWRWTPLPPSEISGARAVAVGTDLTCEVRARRVAQQAVLASEARVRALFRALPDLVFRMDREGRFLEFYAANDSMLYAAPEEIVGRRVSDLLPEPIASDTMASLRRALETGSVQCHEYALAMPAGRKYFEARHIATEGGNEVLATVRDITERRVAENALRESERQYRMLMDRASDPIVIIDGSGVVLSANRQACRLFGRQEAELLSMNMADLVPGDQVEGAADYFGALQHDQPRRIERRILHRDGHPIDVELSVTVLPDGRVQGILRDITERKRAEEALRRSEASFRRLIERTPALIAVHRGGRLKWVNDSCARLFGTPREELIGRMAIDLVHPEDRPMVIERMRRQQETGEPVPPIEERFIRADGTTWIAEVAAIPLEFQGKPSIIVIAHDITDRKQAEQGRRALETRIQQTQKLESLGVLAGGIAHDFNNLLMGVLGNASLALAGLAPESPTRESLLRIEKAAHRAAELTRQLLAYSGRGRFLVQPLDLSRLVQEMVHLLQTVVSKKAMLRLDYADDLPAVEADASQVRQVVMNLITNASDALGDQSGVIAVRTGVMAVDDEYLCGTYLQEDIKPGDYVFVEVSDTGCGMSQDEVQKVFDPFYTTKFTGRGLGLAAVIGIVRGHHGAIKVYSEPNEGTCFKVLFPATKAVSRSSRPPVSSVSTWKGSGLVLVVDDEETVRSVAQLALERHGFSVLLASDGMEALRVYDAEERDIALVVLDLTMPRMGGEETFRELRKRDGTLRILLSSGYNEQETTHRFSGRGLSGFIQKPYTTTELLERVKAILERASEAHR